MKKNPLAMGYTRFGKNALMPLNIVIEMVAIKMGGATLLICGNFLVALPGVLHFVFNFELSQ